MTDRRRTPPTALVPALALALGVSFGLPACKDKKPASTGSTGADGSAAGTGAVGGTGGSGGGVGGS